MFYYIAYVIMVSNGGAECKKTAKANAATTVRTAAESAPSMQLSMFQLDDPVLIQIRDQIKGIDINSLTPLEALNKLNEIKKIAGI